LTLVLVPVAYEWLAPERFETDDELPAEGFTPHVPSEDGHVDGTLRPSSDRRSIELEV